MTDLFSKPDAAEKLDLNTLNGRLLLIKTDRVVASISTVLGARDATVADVHVVDGDDRGEVYEGAYIWPKVLQAQLRSKVGTGRYCLGRLTQGTAKPGQNAPWKLADPTASDEQIAREYLADLADDTF
jgi:hypothetical protein